MAPGEFSEDFYKGPAFALVIGISNYLNGCEPQGMIPVDKLPNLKFAAKDAEDFADFLRNYGFIGYNVNSLIDEQATEKAIRAAFDDLADNCSRASVEGQNPLVIVFFSGHGMVDQKGRHFLVPYDGDRSQLYLTSLWSANFRTILDEIKTDRLIVFIDACHSGGMTFEDAKGEAEEFDPRRDLGEGSGRYIISSCKPGEKSWEGENNGIFTHHLLELLNGETEDIDTEEIDVFSLFSPLRRRVLKEAQTLHQAHQEPTSEIRGATGIVLAINKRVRQKREGDELQEDKYRNSFLEEVCEALRGTESGYIAIVQTKLRSYVTKGVTTPGYESFYQIFDEYASGNFGYISEVCDDLIHGYEFAMKSSQKRRKAVRAAVDQVVESKATKDVTATEAQPRREADTKEPRRLLTTDDREYVLESILTDLDYYSQARKLDDRLRNPVSEGEFARTIHHVRPEAANDPLHGILAGIIERFKERWPNAKSVESQGLTSLMLGKDTT